jgi:hypothetical protein
LIAFPSATIATKLRCDSTTGRWLRAVALDYEESDLQSRSASRYCKEELMDLRGKLVAGAMSLGVLAGVAAFGAAQGRAQTAGTITVLAVCNTEPETTAILNNTDTAINIVSVSSIKDPQPFEPITINQTLAPGASVTYYLGPSSPFPAISNTRIYDNTAADEGAVVVTSAGTLTALCGSGSASLSPGGATALPSPTPSPTSVVASPGGGGGQSIAPPNTGDGGLR